jgi:predicted Zn-dependent protease
MASRPKTSRRDQDRRNRSADTAETTPPHDVPPVKENTAGVNKPSWLARIRFWFAPIVLLLVLAAAYPAWLRYQDWAEFDNARRLIDNWDLVRGIRTAEKYRARHKTQASAAWLLARGYRRYESLKDAERELKLAEQLGHPKNEIELERMMLEAAQGKMQPLLQRVESPFPLPDYYFADSCASLAAGYVVYFDWGKAIQWLDKWSRVETDQPEALNRIGAVYFRAVDYDMSREIYETVLKRWPRNRNANLALGDDKLRDNNFQGALDHFVLVAEDDPESPSVWQRICKANLQRGELEYAEEAAEKMRPLTLRSGDLEADLMALDLQIDLRRAEEARDTKKALLIADKFENYLASRPYDISIQFEYGRALKLAGKFKDAEAQQQKHSRMFAARDKADEILPTIMHDPDNIDLRVEFAQLLVESGDTVSAQKILQSIIARDPHRQDAIDLCVKLFRESRDEASQQAANALLDAVADQRKRLASQSKDSPPPNKAPSE